MSKYSSVYNELRLEEELCDAVVRVDSAEFLVHKIILCNCNPYFRWAGYQVLMLLNLNSSDEQKNGRKFSKLATQTNVNMWHWSSEKQVGETKLYEPRQYINIPLKWIKRGNSHFKRTLKCAGSKAYFPSRCSFLLPLYY